MKNSHPQWESFVLNVEDVRGLDTPFTISVFDYNKDGGICFLFLDWEISSIFSS